MNSIVHIQLLSGLCYSFEILKGCRMFHLRNELADMLDIRDVTRVVLHTESYEEMEEQEHVVSGSLYHVVIQDPPLLCISYEKGELVLRWNGERLDVAEWRCCRQEGRSYSGVVVPDKPFTLQMDRSIGEEAYRLMIQLIRKEWEAWQEWEAQEEQEEGRRIPFTTYYLSRGPDALPMMDEEDGDGMEEEADEEADEEELLMLEPSHHLYAYLCSYLPRDRNLYERMLHPLRIQHYEFL